MFFNTPHINFFCLCMKIYNIIEYSLIIFVLLFLIANAFSSLNISPTMSENTKALKTSHQSMAGNKSYTNHRKRPLKKRCKYHLTFFFHSLLLSLSTYFSFSLPPSLSLPLFLQLSLFSFIVCSFFLSFFIGFFLFQSLFSHFPYICLFILSFCLGLFLSSIIICFSLLGSVESPLL